MSYASHFSTKQTPQSQPIPGKAMVPNSAGGFTFTLDDFERLDRFLILGNEGGTYYASEKKLTIKNAECVLRCAKADFQRTINRIFHISMSGRAPKNDPAIFALAICAGADNPECRAYALSVMPQVCRIGTHLFQFVDAVQQFRGWGRSLQTGVAKWYSRPDAAYQVVKYQQRNGVSHRDVLRLCHRRLENEELVRWIIGAGGGERQVKRRITKAGVVSERIDQYPAVECGDVGVIIHGFDQAKNAGTADAVAALIEHYNLPREAIPTKWLNSPKVWEALLQKMPPHAMLRNLGKMTNVGLLAPMSQAVGKVVADLCDGERLRKSRLHPIDVLKALLTYAQGHGDKGKLSWSPVTQIVDALDGAFYKTFGNVIPTNKRWFLACDISPSMYSGCIAGFSALTPGMATAALALVTAAVEPQHAIGVFAGRGLEFRPLSPRQRLDDVMHKMRGAGDWSGTDCALPMIEALKSKVGVDAFVVITDNETWKGSIHATQVLQEYRNKMGIPAKLIVIGMTATEFTIADPNDAGSMDVVGFDTATPQLMSDFVGGEGQPAMTAVDDAG